MTTARRHAWRPRQRYDKGFILMALLVLLTMGGLYFLVSNLTPEAIEARRQAKTEAALVEARDALIGYALQYREQQIATGDPAAMYGHLPLPDFGESVNRNGNLVNQPCTSEGCAKINPAGVSGSTVIVGRFPWKTVGTAPLRDGHAECLWYAISATHRAVSSTAATMNWDTLAVPDVVIGSGLATLAAVNAHDRPIAVIFSAGAAFDGGRTTSADATECGGNYDVTHYVNAALNNAQRFLPVTSATLFNTLRKSTVRAPLDPPSRRPSFRDDINDMIEGMIPCARDHIFAGSITANAKVADACSIALDAFAPRGYYSHYRDQVFIAKCSTCQVTVDNVLVPSCAGAMLFGNQRSSGQNRRDAAEISNPNNYLEDPNLTSFNSSGDVYAGASKLMPAPAQPLGQDIVRCIPTGPSQTTVGSPSLSSLAPGVTSLASYAAASQTLTLGVSNVGALSTDALANTLFGCSWAAEPHSRGNGFRTYFRFKIRDTGDGFTFAIVDADRNINIGNRCGAARQHLGYSGNNSFTLPIEYPKIAIEFDTSRNPGFVETGNQLTNGRNDPCYRSSCPLPNNGLNSDSHMAIMYWGHQAGTAAVTYPDRDDNVHGIPSIDDPVSRPAPRNATPVIPHPFPAPYPPLAISPEQRLRDTTLVNRDFHVRVEVTPQTRTAGDESVKRRAWKIEAWLIPTAAKVITNLAWAQDIDPDTGLPKGSGTVTVTAPGHDFGINDIVSIREAPSAFNGNFVVKASDQAAGTFKFAKYPDPGTTILTGQPVAMKQTLQVSRMKTTTDAMSNLSPVVKNNACTSDADCGSSQSCSGADSLGVRYCYTGHQPTVYDQQYIYDIDNGDGTYQDALGSIRLGFTIGVGSSDQVIDISELFTTWLP